ncbi:MAG TPA: hypothetical protein VN516_05925, partial [Candidatus Baltobacteraceae bacterium]|nr:hypothetical protein [Candidatus Baltobacteraceae bacterium]
MPHLPALRHCAQVLELRAIAELQTGESERALADAKLDLQLAEKLRYEPFVESQLTRIVIVQDAIQIVYEGLAAHKWSDVQLTGLDAELAKLDFLADYQFAMRAENALRISETEYFHRTRDFHALDNADYVNDYGAFYKKFLPWAPVFIFYKNELNIARLHQQWIFPLVNIQSGLVRPDIIRMGAGKSKDGSPYDVLARMFFHALTNSMPRFPLAQSSVNLARTAIALEHYRLANGNYPDSLDVLAPQFIKTIPSDIFGGPPSPGSGAAGKPLQYRHDPASQSSGAAGGQFILYSIGWNETDDGGVPEVLNNHLDDYRKGDLVWRYPRAE